MTRIGRMHGQPQTANRKPQTANCCVGVRRESLSSRSPTKPLLVHPLHPRHPLEPCVLDARSSATGSRAKLPGSSNAGTRRDHGVSIVDKCAWPSSSFNDADPLIGASRGCDGQGRYPRTAIHELEWPVCQSEDPGTAQFLAYSQLELEQSQLNPAASPCAWSCSAPATWTSRHRSFPWPAATSAWRPWLLRSLHPSGSPRPSPSGRGCRRRRGR